MTDTFDQELNGTDQAKNSKEKPKSEAKKLEPKDIAPAELKKLFDAYDAAAKKLETAREAFDLATAERSEAVRQIQEQTGRTQFTRKGTLIFIMNRNGNYFFRGEAKKDDVLEVG